MPRRQRTGGSPAKSRAKASRPQFELAGLLEPFGVQWPASSGKSHSHEGVTASKGLDELQSALELAMLHGQLESPAVVAAVRSCTGAIGPGIWAILLPIVVVRGAGAATDDDDDVAGLLLLDDDDDDEFGIEADGSGMVDTGHPDEQRSLLGILLRVSALQAGLLEVVFDAVMMLGTDEASLSEEELPELLSQDAPRLLLRHCRWLPFVQDRHGLRTRCNEALQALPERLVRCLLDDLPDILGQGAWSDDAELSTDLQAALSCHPGLIVPVLSAASQLSPTGRLDPRLAEQASLLLGACTGDAVASIVKIVIEAAFARDAETKPRRPGAASSKSSSTASAAAAGGSAVPSKGSCASPDTAGSWLQRAMRQVRERVDLSTMEPDAVAMLVTALAGLATTVPSLSVELAKLFEAFRTADGTDGDEIEETEAGDTSAGGRGSSAASVVSAGARSAGSASAGPSASKSSASGSDWFDSGCLALNAVPAKPVLSSRAAASISAAQLAMLASATAEKQETSAGGPSKASAVGSEESLVSAAGDEQVVLELDLWMMFSVATARHHLPKRGFDAVCAAATIGLIPPSLIKRSILKSFAPLRPLHSGILCVGVQLLRGSSSAGRAVGAHILEQAFLASASDPVLERDVMAAIVSVIGQTTGQSRDIALAILLSLVSARGPIAAGRVWTFREQLKSLFDFAAPLTERQARAVYDILFRAVAGVSGAGYLASSSPRGSRMSLEAVDRPPLSSEALLAASELDVLLSKQLAHPLPQYRALGLLGSGAKIRWLAAGVESGAQASQGAQALQSSSSEKADHGMSATIDAMLKCAEQSQADLGIALAELHWSAGAGSARPHATVATAASAVGDDSGAAWFKGVDFAAIEAGIDRPLIGFLQAPGTRLCTGVDGLQAAQGAAQTAMSALFTTVAAPEEGDDQDDPAGATSQLARALQGLGEEYEGTGIEGVGMLGLDEEVMFGLNIGKASVTMVTEDAALQATQAASSQSRETMMRMLALAVGVAPAVSQLGTGTHSQSGGSGAAAGDGASAATASNLSRVGLLGQTLAGRAPLLLRSIVATCPSVFGEIDDVLLAMISIPVPSASTAASTLSTDWGVVSPDKGNAMPAAAAPVLTSASEDQQPVLGELEKALSFTLEDLSGPKGVFIARGLLAAASWLRAVLAHMSVRLLQDLENHYHAAVRGAASPDVTVEVARGDAAAGWSYLATRATQLVALESAAARAVFGCGDGVAAELAAQAARAGIELKQSKAGISYARLQSVQAAKAAIGVKAGKVPVVDAESKDADSDNDDDDAEPAQSPKQKAKKNKAGAASSSSIRPAAAADSSSSSKGAQAKLEKRVVSAWAVCVSELPALGPQEACALLALPPSLFSERLVSSQVALAAMESAMSPNAAAAAMPLTVARPLIESVAAGLDAAPAIRLLQSEAAQRLAAARAGSGGTMPDSGVPDAGVLLGQHVSKCSGLLAAILQRCVRSLGGGGDDDDDDDDDHTVAADWDPRLYSKDEAASSVTACLGIFDVATTLAVKVSRSWPFRGAAPAELVELTTSLTRVISQIAASEPSSSSAAALGMNDGTTIASSDHGADAAEDSAVASVPQTAEHSMPLAALHLCRAACSAFDTLKTLPEDCHSLTAANSAIKLLSSLLAVRDTFVRRYCDMTAAGGAAHLHEWLSACCLRILCLDWGKDVKSSASAIRGLAREHLTHARSPAAAVSALAKGPLAEVSSSAASETMPTLQPQTVAGVWEEAASAAITALTDARRRHSVRSKKHGLTIRNGKRCAVAAQKIASACKVLFVARVRGLPVRGILVACLRQGRSFVAELQAWQPLFPQLFRRVTSVTDRFLHNCQHCVRQMHTVMQHSKEVQDRSLMKHVPRLKQAIESFVLGVRSEMGRAGAAGAISVQNLKHRTVEGVEVSSQIVEPSDSDEDELDEEEDDDMQAQPKHAMKRRDEQHDDDDEEDDQEEEEEEEEDAGGRRRGSKTRQRRGDVVAAGLDDSTASDEHAGEALTAEMAQLLQKLNTDDNDGVGAVDLGMFDDEADEVD